MTAGAGETYGASYFAHSCGRPYRRDEHWLGFFGAIADRIVEDFHPASVLDAGCAMGFLVEALRDRGVDAHGIDVSEYALGQVREDVRPYCRLASLTDPLERDYDLIVSIEVLEHLLPADAETAIENLCSHTGEILFSSTPTDFSEATHVNVRPTSYWVAQFARQGMLADAAYDASYVTSWARRFRCERAGFSQAKALRAYEQRLLTLAEELEVLSLRRDELELVAATRTFRYRSALLERYVRLRRRGEYWKRRLTGSAAAGPRPADFKQVRAELAQRWLDGEGIEIGALHQPLEVPTGAAVRYVDRMSLDELHRQYPELRGQKLTAPDIVDDGERLATIADSSLDFVIANHFVEHCQDPLGALENALRVLRPGGVLYLAVPDHRRTFDRRRPPTAIAHVERDHRESPAWSRRAHYDEFAAMTGSAESADELLARDYSIHFHVWTPGTFHELLEHCRTDLDLPFDLVELRPNGAEFLVVRRKTDARANG